MKFYPIFRFSTTNLTNFFLTCLILGLFFPSASAQTVDQILQNARNLERAQYFEEALKIYEKVYQGSQNNVAVIAGIKNCYIGLQRYEELIKFLEEIIKQQNYAPTWQVDLAEVYFLNNQRERAFELWNSLLQQSGNNESTYRLVASAMIRQRQFNEAIAVYTEAIKKFNGQQILHVDIATLYSAQLNYEKSAEHLLLYYHYYPKQFNFVQRQLLLLSDKSETMAPITEAITHFLIDHPEQQTIREMLAGFYIKDRNFALALECYKNLENQQTAGIYLHKFSTEALANHAFAYAIEGFELLLASYPASPLRLQSYFDLGRAYASDAYALDQSAMSANRMQQAVVIFNTIISANEKADYVGRSKVFLGDIYFDYYFDLDQAIDLYHSYLESHPAGREKSDVLLRLGDAYLTKNQTSQALSTYRLVQDKDARSLAAFKIAEVYYFQKNFKQASKILQDMQTTLLPHDPLMNDILGRKVLIDAFQGDTLFLSRYADAELLSFQKKYTQAAEQYEILGKTQSRMQSLAGRQAAKLYLRLGQYSQASELLFYLKDAIPLDKDMDEILYLLAEAEEQQNHKQAALDIYHELMLRFPNSLFLQKARERARTLSQKSDDRQI
jgi:tetratricopeptide (TPR) repeat protein